MILAAFGAIAQQTINGKVTDLVNGEALTGVNVVIKGTTKGTITDIDGAFQIVANSNDVLVFSFIGYRQQEVAVNGKNSINVLLEQSTETLDELVIVGYGVQSKKVVTGAISQVDAESIQRVAVTGLDQAMQGKVAGVQVTQNSGAPGGAVSIRVRGTFSATSGANEPLYVVDGVPLNTNPMQVQTASGTQMGNAISSINPADIESIEILKDASAAAIYGSRAARGVVLITTKRGKSGEGVISFDAYYGIQSLQKQIPMANATQWGNFQVYVSEISKQKLVADWKDDPSVLGVGTNWQDEVFHPAAVQNYNLSFSGGNDRSTYSISGNYYNHDGIILNSNFKRYSMRVNTDNKVKSWFNAGNSFYFGRTQDIYVRTDDQHHGIIKDILQQTPALPLMNEDGTYAGPVGAYMPDIDNPYAKNITIDQNIARNKLIASVYGEIIFSKNLRLRSNFGIDYTNTNQLWFEPTYVRGSLKSETAKLIEWKMEHTQWINENVLTYSNSFGKHNVVALAGISAQEHFYNGIKAGGTGFQDESLKVINQSSLDSRTSEGWKGHGAIASQFGRITYDFDSKYLFTANIRRDGSFKFGPENRWGVFPSISAGWRFTAEPFWENFSNILSEGKLRAGYGQVGSDAINDYEYLSTINTTQIYYVFNDASGQELYAPAAVPTKAENPKLKWESSEETTIGTDLAFLNNRLTLNMDYFIKNTKDMLITKPIPATSGMSSSPRVNGGKVQNKGFEMEISFRKVTGDFQYSIGANFTSIQNKVLYLAGEEDKFDGMFSRTMEGYPIGAFFGYQVEGIFQTQDEIDELNNKLTSTDGSKVNYQSAGTAPGDIKFKDISGPDGIPDGRITPLDRTILGSPHPAFTYGFNLNLSYKGFDMVAVVDGIYGNQIVNTTRMWTENLGLKRNLTLEAYENYWRPDRPGNIYPRPVVNDVNQNNRFSDRWLEDGSYVRLRTLTIGYTIPTEVAAMFKIKSMRLYLSGQNLWIHTKYSGYDPEVGIFQGNSLNAGIDYGRYPSPKTIMFGVNLRF